MPDSNEKKNFAPWLDKTTVNIVSEKTACKKWYQIAKGGIKV